VVVTETTALAVPNRTALVAAMLDIADAAAALIRDIVARAGGAPGAVLKDDGSPVTEADQAADALIRARLLALAPGVPVVSEENAASHGLAPPSRFWLVDPIDGTKEFIAGRPEYTVNIALVDDGVPVLGVVLAPATGDLYWVDETGGACCRGELQPAGGKFPIVVRTSPAAGLTAAVSRSHRNAATDAFLAAQPIAAEITCGSSLKFCIVARGDADISPRFGPTNEWDTAAGDAIVRAAGGSVRTLDGAPLRYGKPRFANPDYVIRGR
jgi:3'(2'), 5'-bisphosphate nucleotidase